MYVLFCIHFACTLHTLFTFQIPTRARSVNPSSWSDEGRLILKPQGPQSQDPRSVYVPLRLVQVKFYIGKWKCSRESRVVMHHQIYGFPPKKIQDQQNSSTHFVRWSSTEKKSAEILGPNVESAVVHYTKPEDEFHPGKGLNTKFRRDFFSAEVRYTICVVEFRWKLKSAKIVCSRSGAQDLNFPLIFFSRSHAP